MILTLEQLLAMTSEQLKQSLINQNPNTKTGLENTHKIIDLLSSK